MGKKRRQQLVSTENHQSFTTDQSYLVIDDLTFDKLGGFTVDETIAYQLLANNSSQRLIDIMVLAQEIAHDLDWSYGQSIEALNQCGTEITIELVAYATRIKEIGLFDFSDARRKSDIVHQFIVMRGYPDWTHDQTRRLLYSQMMAIYNFMMAEYHEWKEMPVVADDDLGKSSNIYENNLPPTLEPIGENAISTSNPPGSVTVATTPPISMAS